MSKMKLSFFFLFFIIIIISPFKVFGDDGQIFVDANGVVYKEYNDKYSVTNYYGTGNELIIPGVVNGKNVDRIETGAFSNKSSIISISLPDTIMSIGDSAFSNCTSLKTIAIPNGVSSIGPYTFSGCNNLTSIIIPNSVTSIGDYAFYNSKLTSVIIPNSVISIGEFAFSVCTSLANLTIGDSVTSIGRYAFFECNNLINVTIPKNVTSIGKSAFDMCWQLSSIEVDASNEYYSSIDGVLFNKSANAIINYPISKLDSSYIIPNSVTHIEEWAFYNCPNLTSITVPNSLISIRNFMFSSCRNLTRIEAEYSNEYYSSVDGVLFNKSANVIIAYPAGKSDTSYSIPDSVTRIEEGAFYGGINLISVTIPNSVTSIGQVAFCYSNKLAFVNMGNSVTSIGEHAFYTCPELTNINIPNSVTSIGDYAFASCTNLASVNIGDSVTSIGSQAFYSTKITSITIPPSVTSIGLYAFFRCENMVEIQFLGDAPTIDESVFYGCKQDLIIYYICGKKGFTNPWYGRYTTKIGIEATTLPQKTNYVVGESIDLTGLVVTEYYKDGTTEVISTSELSISGFDSGTPAIGQIITVGINGKTSTFAVNILPKTYTVTFNSNGGSGVESTTAEYNAILAAPTLPTRTGYVFRGWYKEVGCLNEWSFITDKITANTTLYAKWSRPIITPVRYAGQNRFETAVQVSKAGWVASQNVVLVNAYGFADALTGVPFAYRKDAPILLTGPNAIPMSTSDEIKRLGAKNIYILGGTGVVSTKLENDLKNNGFNVFRLDGSDRYETAIKIGSEVLKDNLSKTAVLTTAYNYPDALAISSYAAINKYPILYTQGNVLNGKTSEFLKNKGITKVIIPGGVGVVSENVAKELTNSGITVERISGKDRYETALNIVNKYKSSFKKEIMISTGSDFPDALAGGVLAAKREIPILLVGKDVIKDEVKSYIQLNDVDGNLYILGGTGVVSEQVVKLIIEP